MAKNENRRLSPAEVAKDLELYNALKGVDKYKPANPDYDLPAILTRYNTLNSTQESSAQADVAADTARDLLIAAQWDFHNGMLGAKNSVVAQFGLDSNEAQAMQLKKKSEYKARPRKKKGPTS
jgi:hypothetical protein